MRSAFLGLGLAAILSACSHAPAPGADHPPAVTGATTLATATLAPPRPPAPTPRSPAAFATALAEHDRAVAEGASPERLAALRAELDRLAAQRDAHTSRLYWYTDLEEAKAEAKRSGRPILSLHLLGRLDEELSCANSRLFRIVLYANTDVSAMLRDKWVLHWTSERPVPRMTIDYGDGRVVERTIAGNSVHYVLDAEGRVIDALPGLYGPKPFAKGLEDALELAKKSADLDDEASKKAVAKHHEQALWRLTALWRRQLKRAYGESYGDTLDVASLPTPVGVNGWPHPVYGSLPAEIVNQLTVSKGDNEAPPLALMQPQIRVISPWDGWDKIAQQLPAETLDAASLALLRAKSPRDWTTKDARALDAAELDKHVATFQHRLAEEEARNEFVFHGAIHQRLAKASRVELAPLDAYVYTKLFMTPPSDPWLGLMPVEALTGLADDGVVTRR